MQNDLLTKNKNGKKSSTTKTLGPVADLEKHLPQEWWKTLFNSLYLKTDGDVVENDYNTRKEIDLLIDTTKIQKDDFILDLCCGQGRHSLELAQRGYVNVMGIDRSRYLVRLAKSRSKKLNLKVNFSEGDARKIRVPANSQDCIFLMGNSFGYFEKPEDDIEVLKNIKNILVSRGTIFLDIVDGGWMKKNFEPRSWEWIDQNHFVCRERKLSEGSSRIISREVVVNAEVGVIADQFYAERLYTYEEIEKILAQVGYEDITLHGNLSASSFRKQDLGMMENRLIVSATSPQKKVCIIKDTKVLPVTVLLGDPELPDTVKRDSQFNPEDFETIHKLKNALKELSVQYKFTYLSNHKNLLQNLMKNQPKLVFNLCDEGYKNNSRYELHIPALLELLEIPYSGCNPDCLSLCHNKNLVRAIAADLDIPVPLETYCSSVDQSITIPSIFPAILKPNFGDGSIGITQDAVVNNTEELLNYLNKLQETVPNVPVLIQEFLPGREFTVGIIGNPGKFEYLPILEVDYSDLPDGLPPILSYESKYIPDSPYWNEIKYFETMLDEENQRKLIDYSTLLFDRLGCQDYARFDFRMDKDNQIKLLEINPNPGWCWDGKMNIMAGYKGLSYSQFLDMILKATRERLNI